MIDDHYYNIQSFVCLSVYLLVCLFVLLCFHNSNQMPHESSTVHASEKNDNSPLSPELSAKMQAKFKSNKRTNKVQFCYSVEVHVPSESVQLCAV